MSEIVENNEKATRLGGITGKGFMPGQSGNPGGRPKDTMKQYLRQKFSDLTPEQKEAWLISNNVSGEFQLRMGEGNPTEDKNITIKVPTPILGGSSQAITAEASVLLEGAATSNVLDESTKS